MFLSLSAYLEATLTGLRRLSWTVFPRLLPLCTMLSGFADEMHFDTFYFVSFKWVGGIMYLSINATIPGWVPACCLKSMALPRLQSLLCWDVHQMSSLCPRSQIVPRQDMKGLINLRLAWLTSICFKINQKHGAGEMPL